MITDQLEILFSLPLDLSELFIHIINNNINKDTKKNIKKIINKIFIIHKSRNKLCINLNNLYKPKGPKYSNKPLSKYLLTEI